MILCDVKVSNCCVFIQPFVYIFYLKMQIFNSRWNTVDHSQSVIGCWLVKSDNMKCIQLITTNDHLSGETGSTGFPWFSVFNKPYPEHPDGTGRPKLLAIHILFALIIIVIHQRLVAKLKNTSMIYSNSYHIQPPITLLRLSSLSSLWSSFKRTNLLSGCRITLNTYFVRRNVFLRNLMSCKNDVVSSVMKVYVRTN